MNTYAYKAPENKRQETSTNLPQKHHQGVATAHFVNNRPETNGHRELQQLANNSQQVHQFRAYQEMANNSKQVKQLKAFQAKADHYTSVHCGGNANSTEENIIQERSASDTEKEDKTGLPGDLKSGVEKLSGYSMEDVQVHYHSDKPEKLDAHAYAQGSDIYLAEGQEKHLPHEAWHVVQQKQGRVKATWQMKGGSINDEHGLEKEADLMGSRAMQQPDISTETRHDLLPATTAAGTIQRVSKVYVGADEVKKTDTQGPKVFEAVNHFTKNFPGEVWFNSPAELVTWVKSGGKVEGLGLWNGRWMNFTHKGPIVFGEEHNEIRMEFIRALNIQHFVVEGAFERSLTGVEEGHIPRHSQDPQSHKKYTGDETGKALENFWVRSGLSMERFWIDFENDLKNLDPDDPHLRQIERLDELEELIRTVIGVRADTRDKTGIGKQINEEILNAQFYLQAGFSTGLNDMIELMKIKDYRAYVSRLPKVSMQINARGQGLHYLYVCFSDFRKSIQKIAYLQFKAAATEDDLEADEETKNSKDPFKVWGGRRELFMLKNLEEALEKSPKPLIITVGVAHARNQKHKLEELLSRHGGMLVMGTIADLADVGATRLHAVSEAISQELALVYSWSERYRQQYAESDEAREKAKIRIGTSKKPVPEYIS